MDRVNRLAAGVRLDPGESRLVTLLFVEYFFLGVASVFTQTAAFALFLAEFGSQGLPPSYIATAFGASFVAFLYFKLSQRLALATSLVINLGGLALISLLLRLGLAQPETRGLVFGLPIWFQIVANLTNLALWSLAARLFDVRQGKRLFGLIGSGNWLAIAAGGFFVAPIVARLGTPNLLLLAGLALGVALGFQLILLRENKTRLDAPTAVTRATHKTAGWMQALGQNRYLGAILVLVSLMWMGFFFIDNIFYNVATAQISDANQLASFIGTLIAAIGVIGLVTTTFITGPVIRRLGVGNSLLILPGILTASIALLALTGTAAGLVVVTFALAILSKTLDVSLAFTLDLSARTILYQPFPAHARARIQTLADGIVQPIAIGVAGILLLVCNTVFGCRTAQLALVFLVIGLGWILAALRLRRDYPLALVQALAKRRLGENANLQPDRTCIELLRQSLHSSNAGAVIYAANLLQELDPRALADALPALLAHPAALVRRDALERMERLRLSETLPSVNAQLTVEPLAELRGLALRVTLRVGGASERERAMRYLGDSSPTVRSGVISGLLDGEDGEGQRAAAHELQNMVTRPAVAERIGAAETLGEVRTDGQEDLLRVLLNDTDVRVQRAALRAAGKTRPPAMWDAVIEQIRIPRLRRAAVAALINGQTAALPSLDKAFHAPNAQPDLLAALAQVCGRIGGPDALALLKRWLDQPDPRVRTAVLVALSRCQYRAGKQDAALVHSQIRSEVARAALIFATLADLGQDPALGLLRDALGTESKRGQDRIFYLLSFLYDRAAILNARAQLTRASSEMRAYALEVLDSWLPRELRAIVFPLVENVPPAQALAQLAAHFPQPQLSRDERLREILAASNPVWTVWVKTTARYGAERLGLSASGAGAEGGLLMLSTIEKLLVLKQVEIFAETPDDVLANVAAACDDLEIQKGETVFNKGEPGDTLYVIVSGRVQVHDGAVNLNELGEGDVFGEMALLDPEPRLASVTALEDARLLRLDEESFQELLEEQSEIARSIIKVLTRRLRARVQDLTKAVSAGNAARQP